MYSVCKVEGRGETGRDIGTAKSETTSLVFLFARESLIWAGSCQFLLTKISSPAEDLN